MTKAMRQVHSVQAFDQQLYAIAKQVEWAIPETFRNHTVRLGGFHTLSCYIAAIGKLWGACENHLIVLYGCEKSRGSPIQLA
jgi:hypothetical protein